MRFFCGALGVEELASGLFLPADDDILYADERAPQRVARVADVMCSRGLLTGAGRNICGPRRALGFVWFAFLVLCFGFGGVFELR